MSPADLVQKWQQEAAQYDRDGQPGARLLQRVADELEAALRAASDDVLTLGEAAKESGYSADHLRREIRVGNVPNAGRRNAPRIRRGDLPVKAGRLTRPRTDTTSPVQIARSVVHARPIAR